MRDLFIAVAEYLHIADRAGAAIDDGFGEQIHEQQEDEYCETYHHADHGVHHVYELVAHRTHVIGGCIAGIVARVQGERFIANVSVEVRLVVVEHRVEVVDAHVHIHIRFRTPGVFLTREGKAVGLVFVLVVEVNLLVFIPAELVCKTCAEYDFAIADIKILPIAGIWLYAIDCHSFGAVVVSSVVLKLVDGVFLCLVNGISAVVGGVYGANIVIVCIDVSGLFHEVDDIVAVASKSVGNVIYTCIESVLFALCFRKGVGCRLCRFCGRRCQCSVVCILCGICCIFQLVLRIFCGGKQRAGDGLQAFERSPRFSFFGCSLKFERRLQGVGMFGNEACFQVVGVMCHSGQDGQAEKQEQAGESNSYKECGKVAKVPQEDTKAKARHEA